jgi:gamma-glutamyltranspeptidase/glutathione hydrolase
VKESHVKYTREEIVAGNGVVAAGHELVARIGVETMKRGGNAIDAAVAAAFAAQVAEPGMCGLGGNGIIQVCSPVEPGRTVVFDDTTVPPAAATPGMFEVLPGTGGFYGWDNVRGDANIIGHRSVAIPGTVAGLCAALQRYGTMDLPSVLGPVIELAGNGLEVDRRTAVAIASEMRYFEGFPALGDLLLVDGLPPTPGTFWAPGDRMAYPELAASYRLIAAEGPDAFYRGGIARSISDDMERSGGILTYDDLATYDSDVREFDMDGLPEYRGLKYSPGHSTFLVQVLNILGNFRLDELGPNSPALFHVMLEAMRRAWVNYFAYPREPGLLTGAYAAEVAGLIDAQTVCRAGPVDPSPYQEQPAAIERGPATPTGGNTTTITAADRQGNVVNLLTSLGNSFGSKVVVPGTGIVLNDHMCNFDPVPGRALSLGPTRRPPPGAHVPIFFRDGRPFLAADAPGARRSMSGVLHVLVNCIDFGMGVQAAIETPRVWAEALYDESFVDLRIPEPVRRDLERRGHTVVAMDPAGSGGFGRPTAVSIDSSGMLHAGADPLYGTGVAGF